MAEKVRITRRDGRIWKAEVLSRGGEVLCELPLTGVEYVERTQEPATAKLLMHGPRVEGHEFGPPPERLVNALVVAPPRPDERVDTQPADPTAVPLPPRPRDLPPEPRAGGVARWLDARD